MTRLAALLFLCCAWLAPPASAQLGQLPLPDPPIAGGVLGQAREAVDVLGEPIQDLRRLQIRDLLRAHRRELERGPGGEPIVRSQILALGVSEDAIAAARARGFELVASDPIGDAGDLVTLLAPAGITTQRALRQLRQSDPTGVYDFDHLHLESGANLIAPAFAQAAAAGAGPRIGLIDSGVEPSLAAERRAFAGPTPLPAPHGTFIAQLLRTAAPGARIYAADIYGGAPTGGASSALARALAWLAEADTPVINVSLVGPHNSIIESVITRLAARGFVIVAAVGNDGPAAAPLYPAAYEGVVGVTAVDTRERVLIEAGRGAHVDFAALGVYPRARGTSYAAPIVAARIALGIEAPSRTDAAVAALRSRARDLGARGRDNIYGYGLVEAR